MAAASVSTIERVLEVVEKRLSPIAVIELAEELAALRGNKSFREIIERFRLRARERHDFPGRRRV